MTLKITLTEPQTIPAAVALKLTPQQVGTRNHALDVWGDMKGDFVGTQALHFKAGETIEIVGDIPRGLVPFLDKLMELNSPVEISAIHAPVEITETIKVARGRPRKDSKP
jgi:hypothetical protein